MSSSTVLIINVVGKSYIQHADGSKTILTEGMRIPVNSNVLTTDGSSISIQADGAPAVTIGENNSLLISPELALTTPDVTENAASAIDQPAATVDQVVTALESGQDPFDVLDPTAAVLGGGEGGGSSFTRIIKIIETTTPLALAYPRPTVESPEFFSIRWCCRKQSNTRAYR